MVGSPRGGWPSTVQPRAESATRHEPGMQEARGGRGASLIGSRETLQRVLIVLQ